MASQQAGLRRRVGGVKARHRDQGEQPGLAPGNRFGVRFSVVHGWGVHSQLLAPESGGGPPHPDAAAFPSANQREASWTAPALWRFGQSPRPEFAFMFMRCSFVVEAFCAISFTLRKSSLPVPSSGKLSTRTKASALGFHRFGRSLAVSFSRQAWQFVVRQLVQAPRAARLSSRRPHW